MVADEQRDGRVEVLPLVGCGRVRGDELIAIEHHALGDALGEQFGERGLPDAQRAGGR
jgi:hypothetical protein